jgi:Fic family protein
MNLTNRFIIAHNWTIMFSPRYPISQPLLATLKRIAVQVYVINNQRPAKETLAALHEETQALAAAAIRRGDSQAASNYGRTLLELGNEKPANFDLALLLRIHFRLGRGILPDEQRGRLRRETLATGAGELFTGGNGYQPPEPKVVPVMLNNLVTFVSEQQDSLDPLLLAGIFHRQLLLIRPFEAGNEAAAWLATRILLSGMGLERFDLLAVEECFGVDRDNYLAALGARGNYYGLADVLEFTSWLEYFAEGIATALTALEERYRQHRATPAKMLQPYHRALLDYIDEHGFITDKQYARLTDRAKATRSLDFKKLIEMDLLVREGRGRGIYYRRKT